jgi:hypothetical protein
MRWPGRCLLVVAVPAVLLMASAPAAAETFIGLRSVDCDSVTVSGIGLPASASLVVTLSDPRQRPLERQSLTTSPSGSFLWRTRVSLSGLRSVRAVVTRPGAATPIAWTEHSVPTPCPLVNTGANHAVPLAGLALSAIVAGMLLLTVAWPPGRHVYQGRHVAAR